MGEGLLTGAEITQRHHQSQHQHEWQLTKLGTWITCRAYRQQYKLGRVLPRYYSCPKLFQAAQLFSVSSPLCSLIPLSLLSTFALLLERHAQIYLLTAYSGREVLSESGQFHELPEIILCDLPSCLRSFLQEGMFQSPQETVAEPLVNKKWQITHW